MTYRRARGDMIEVFKIVSSIYDTNTTGNILTRRDEQSILLRGNQFTLEHKRLHSAARVNYFANRVVKVWNSLPDSLVGAGRSYCVYLRNRVRCGLNKFFYTILDQQLKLKTIYFKATGLD